MADGVAREASRVHMLLRAYVRHQGSQVSITAVGDYAYRREDGVLVVPVGTLKD